MDNRKAIAFTFLGFGTFALLFLVFAWLFIVAKTPPAEEQEEAPAVQERRSYSGLEPGQRAVFDAYELSFDFAEYLPDGETLATFWTVVPGEAETFDASAVRALTPEGDFFIPQASVFNLQQGRANSIEINFTLPYPGAGLSSVVFDGDAGTADWVPAQETAEGGAE